MRVLVVDDSGVIRALIRGAIEWHVRENDVELLEASDGVSALQEIESGRIDVALIDWAMPRMDGLEIVRRLRAAGNQVPIVMVTANADDAQRDHALDAGVSAYVVKPFRIAELYGAVEPWIQLARAAR